MSETRLAVMQPYLFPYIGYYQLLYEVDKFVFYDDVSYIKQGYINRNSIIVDGAPKRFTVPVSRVSSNRLINEHFAVEGGTTAVFSQMESAYQNAPYFEEVRPVLREVLLTTETCIAKIAEQSIVCVAYYLGLEKEFLVSSKIGVNRDLGRVKRLITMCEQLGAREYINSSGGRDLYKSSQFEDHNIQLKFHYPKQVEYSQLDSETFSANQSIVDVLMMNSAPEIRRILSQSDVLPA